MNPSNLENQPSAIFCSTTCTVVLANAVESTRRWHLLDHLRGCRTDVRGGGRCHRGGVQRGGEASLDAHLHLLRRSAAFGRPAVARTRRPRGRAASPTAAMATGRAGAHAPECALALPTVTAILRRADGCLGSCCRLLQQKIGMLDAYAAAEPAVSWRDDVWGEHGHRLFGAVWCHLRAHAAAHSLPETLRASWECGVRDAHFGRVERLLRAHFEEQRQSTVRSAATSAHFEEQRHSTVRSAATSVGAARAIVCTYRRNVSNPRCARLCLARCRAMRALLSLVLAVPLRWPTARRSRGLRLAPACRGGTKAAILRHLCAS